MLPRSILFLALGACSVEYYDPADDSGLFDSGLFDSGLSASEDTAAEVGDKHVDGGGPDPDRPVVEAADAWCYLHETGDARWIWSATATATDPQGSATLTPMATQGITVVEDGAALATQALVCGADGACTASWGADQVGMDCSRPEDFVLLFTVVDEDGKVSEPYEVLGRLGSGPEG